jgi:hypothetical protein
LSLGDVWLAEQSKDGFDARCHCLFDAHLDVDFYNAVIIHKEVVWCGYRQAMLVHDSRVLGAWVRRGKIGRFA